jgi:hypothetical protein
MIRLGSQRTAWYENHPPTLGAAVEQSNQDLVKLRTDNLVWRQVGDEVMVLDAASSQYLSVNKTGTVLWPLLLEGCQRTDLVEALKANFGVDDDVAASDAEKFLSSLRDLNLLQPGPTQ